MNHDDIFILAENIFLQKIDGLGKHWVFNIDTGEHYSLNETSYWILERIAEGLSLQNILRDFLNTFGVEEKEGTTDFNDIIKTFLDEGIIERSER